MVYLLPSFAKDTFPGRLLRLDTYVLVGDIKM